jgi:hypothetical protein
MKGLPSFFFFLIGLGCRVTASGRDVRGVRKWSHVSRNGAEVSLELLLGSVCFSFLLLQVVLGASGVLLEDGRVLCLLGAVIEGWKCELK